MTKNDLSSYKNFILLGFVLSTVYALCFFIMRLCLSLYSLDEFSLLKILDANFLPMFVMGLRLDLRAICVVFAFLLLLSLLASLNKSVFMARLKMTTGGAFEKENFSQNLKPNKKSSFCLKIDKFIHKFTLFFVGLTSFLIALSAFVNFYYFKTYHTKIDIFIFGLKDDDTEAILKIMWQDYPVTVILLASFIFAYLCFRLGKKILNANFFAQIELNLNKIYENSSKNSRLMKTSTIATVVLANLMLFVLVFIGARGSVGTFPLREDEHHISTNVLINHIATNPIIAFAWACQHYKAQEGFAPINETQLQALQEELFPIFRTNAPKQIHAKPNVVVVLMESFGTNLLLLDDEEDFDLLMSFRPHFEAGKIKQKGQKDFTFVNFLSAQNGTAPSFASLFFLSPSANLSLSSVKNKLLPLTPFEPYEKAGYELVFITSGNRAWQNLGDYMNTLGVNDVYDSNFLTRHYPQSKDFQSVYGVGDEFAYKFALELLSKATKPLFIVILTTSNHPPYSLPLNFKAPSYKLESKKAFFSQESREKIHKSLSAFSYASNAFGEFIKSIKASSFEDSTVVAMSGDHIYRDLKAYENPVLNHATPFYLYVPNAYTRDFEARKFDFEPHKFGSHKDIFPTLYALSLNECEFLSLGGRNLFDTKSDERYNFAYNGTLWLDEEGIYLRGIKEGFFYKDTAGKKAFFVNSKDKESFELTLQKAEFFDKYDNLDRLQLNYRLFNYQASN